MTWSSMNAACTGIQRYMAAKNNERFTVIQRMETLLALEPPCLNFSKNGKVRQTKTLHATFDKVSGQNKYLPFPCINGSINKIRMQSHCQVCRNSPGSRCPYNDKNLFIRQNRNFQAKIIL